MRIKTLLLTAACAACLATASAQVYSVNAVGYVNTSVPANGFALINNPLDAGAGNNTVVKLFAGVPNFTTLFTFNPATGFYKVNMLEDGEWGFGDDVFAPGGGAFIQNKSAAAITITFVGEVPQGHLVTDFPAGLSVISSKVPQSGQLDTVLGFPVQNLMTVYRYNPATGLYLISTFEDGEWGGLLPVPNVGEAFFIKMPAAGSWARDFSVN